MCKANIRSRNLASGHYRLEVSRSGFATQISELDVQSGTPVSRTITLELLSQASSINVVAVTPLPGTDLSRDQIPSAVQTASAKDIEERRIAGPRGFPEQEL